MSRLVCYRRRNNDIRPVNEAEAMGDPDDEFQPCCNRDTGILRRNNICEDDSGRGQGSVGFYLAGCTDPDFLHESCPRQCSSLRRMDIVWNEETRLWSCCNGTTSRVFCDNPTDITFEAPSPQELRRSPVGSSTNLATTPTSSAFTSSSIATETSTVLLDDSPNPSSGASLRPSSGGGRRGLAGGAIAGIVIAVILLIVMAIGVALILWRRRKTLERYDSHTLPNPPPPPPKPAQWQQTVPPQQQQQQQQQQMRTIEDAWDEPVSQPKRTYSYPPPSYMTQTETGNQSPSGRLAELEAGHDSRRR